MRRPIVAYSLALAIGIVLSVLLSQKLNSGTVITYVIAAPFVVFVLAYLSGRINMHMEKTDKKLHGKGLSQIVKLSLLFFIIGIMICQYQNFSLDKQATYLCQRTEISGLIYDIQKKAEDSYVLFVSTKEGKIRASYYKEIEKINYTGLEGRTVTLHGKIMLPKNQSNPHCFDYRLYLKTKGISAVMNVDYFETGKISSYYMYYLSKWRNRFSAVIEEHSDVKTSGMLNGILFGDKSGIDENLYDEFRKNGSAHILAVSGLHIGIVYGFAEKLTRKKKSRKTSVFKACFVIIYAMIAGFAASTTRACFMILLHIFSKQYNYRYDMLSAACFTALINLIINPLAIFGVGFQLSYMAIITLAVVLNRFQKDNPGILFSSACIQAGLGPIMAYHFNYFSLVTLLINIPVIIIAGLLVPLAIVMLYLSLIDIEIINIMLSKLLEFGTYLLIKCNDIAYLGGESFRYCKSPKVWMLFLYYCILFFSFSEHGFILKVRGNYKKIAVFVLTFVIASCSFQSLTSSPFDRAGLIFVDVGQGDCLHIRTDNGKNILIDGGGSAYSNVGEKILLPYLLKNGVDKIDLAIVTHLHMDHCQGINELCEFMELEKVAVSSDYSMDDVKENLKNFKGEVIFLSQGDTIKPDKRLTLKILFTRKPGEKANPDNENDYSLVVKVTMSDVSALMTADIDSEGEHKLILNNAKDELCCNILKIPHHGSHYSSSEEFLEATQSNYAIIQVGKNNYGHPSDEVIERLDNLGIPVFRNDINGAIGLYDIKNGNSKLVTMKK